MSVLNRRACLKLLLGGLAQTAGTVVLAHAVLPAAVAKDMSTSTDPKNSRDLLERADQVAQAQGAVPLEESQELCAAHSNEFVNGAFRNAGFVNGGFRNAGFNNAAFHNGGFANGGFRNAGFANGGFRN